MPNLEVEVGVVTHSEPEDVGCLISLGDYRTSREVRGGGPWVALRNPG